MRFFVAEGAPQNDGGFMVEKNLWWRFALDELVACVAAEKRWQSHRTLQCAGRQFRLRCSATALALDCAIRVLIMAGINESGLTVE
jgi:hypothetical protein